MTTILVHDRLVNRGLAIRLGVESDNLVTQIVF